MLVFTQHRGQMFLIITSTGWWQKLLSGKGIVRETSLCVEHMENYRGPTPWWRISSGDILTVSCLNTSEIPVISMVRYSWVPKVTIVLRSCLTGCMQENAVCLQTSYPGCLYATPIHGWQGTWLSFVCNVSNEQQRKNVSLWCILHTYFSQ